MIVIREPRFYEYDSPTDTQIEEERREEIEDARQIPAPDQSDGEENARAMGTNFEDNEPLDFVKKMEKRDENRA